MLEKVFNSASAEAESGGRASAFDRAVPVAERYGEAMEARQAGTGGGPGRALKTARSFYDPLVYRKIRNAMGGRVRYAICGGSPLGRRLAAFYAGAGIEIFEGYGLTETTAAATVTPPLKPRLGTVGWPLPRHPHPDRRRRRDPGRRRPGPARLLGPAGGRRRPGRARRLVRHRRHRKPGRRGIPDDHRPQEGTADHRGRQERRPGPAGELAALPPLISQCIVLGDRRPYVSALFTLDPDGVTHWRRMNGKHPVPPELLTDDEEVLAVLQRAVDEANKLVSRPESIRRFAVLPRDSTEWEGHLTPR